MDDYTRGEMDIREQKATFDGFMAIGLWSTGLTGVALVFVTLVFALGWGVMASVATMFAVGVLGGLTVKLPSSWYVVMGGLSFAILAMSSIFKLFGAAFGS